MKTPAFAFASAALCYSAGFALLALALTLALAPAPAAAQESPATVPIPTPTPTAASGDRVALVIGNNDYPDAGNFPDLENCRNDALLIKSALEGAGFSVIYRENADWQGLDESLTLFENTIPKGGTAVFYFAGHGIEFEGKNYLMAANAKLQARSRLGQEGFDAETVAQAMLLAGAKSSFLFLDCCRENPPVEWLSRGLKKRGLADLKIVGDILICFAALPGKSALDAPIDDIQQTDGLPRVTRTNSPYAQALAHAIPLGMDHLRMFQRVRNDVNALTGGQQRTWESGSFLGDFYFTAPRVTSVPVPATTTATGTGTASAEQAAEMAELKALVAKLMAEGAARATPLAQVAPGEKVTLALAPARGTVYKVETVMASTMKGTEKGEPREQNFELASLTRHEVEDSRPAAPGGGPGEGFGGVGGGTGLEAGETASRLRVERVLGSRRRSKDATELFDSASGTEATGGPSQFLRFLNQELLVRTGRDGTMSSIRPADPALEASLKEPTVLFVGFAASLPPGPVAVGESWPQPAEGDLLQGLNLKTSLRNTLSACDALTATVAVEGTATLPESLNDQQAATSRVAGTVVFSRRDGLPLRSDLEIRVAFAPPEKEAGGAAPPETVSEISFRLTSERHPLDYTGPAEQGAAAVAALLARQKAAPAPLPGGGGAATAPPAGTALPIPPTLPMAPVVTPSREIISLVLAPARGSVYGMETTTTANATGFSTTAEGLPTLTADFVATALTRHEVGAIVADDGTFTTQVGVARLHGRFNEPEKPDTVFDTTPPGLGPEEMLRYAGRGIQLQQRRDGVVIEPTPGEEGTVEEVAGMHQMALFRGGVSALPPGPVAVGITWESQSVEKLLLGLSMRVSLAHTLQAFDATTATIALSGTLTPLKYDGTPADGLEAVTSAEIKGTVTLSRVDGLPLRADTTATLVYPRPADETLVAKRPQRLVIHTVSTRQDRAPLLPPPLPPKAASDPESNAGEGAPAPAASPKGEPPPAVPPGNDALPAPALPK